MDLGTLQDRPWGKTLGALARRGVTGQLTVRSRNAWFQIAFEHGLIVGATASSAERPIAIAAKLGVIDETRLPEGASEWERLAAIVPAAELARLRRQTTCACVARSFVFEHGELSLDAEIAIATHAPVQVGGTIFHGARMYLGERRLAAAVHALGSRFTRSEDADLRPFGFSPRERAVAEVLLDGASASLLDRIADREERRSARAIVYALVACGAMRAEGPGIPAGVLSPVPRKARASSPRRV